MGAGHDPPSSPAPIERGFVTLTGIKVGMKAFVEKNGEHRKAEILAIWPRKGQLTFYVHYDEFNKRLDEWVPETRLDLSREVEWTLPKPTDKTDKKSGKANKKAGAATRRGGSNKAGANKTPKSRRSSGRLSRADKQSVGTGEPDDAGPPEGADPDDGDGDGDNDGEGDGDGDVDVGGDAVDINATVVGDADEPSEFSREDELEKLRTGGSLTQNRAEVSRMRNLVRVQIGSHEAEPWYFSPYPQEFSESDMVYICELCFSYFDNLTRFGRHRQKCTLAHPPGNEIYRDDYVSFFEVDGRRQRTWCRNLCLLSKLFLDHKALYYDVDPFLFYCMCTRDQYGCHLVGYFSKEKESADGYNVACILTLPQYQQKGFGKLLIAFSYELSKREGKLGSPEKPLSDLGLLSYLAYWQETIMEMLLDGRSESTIEELGNRAAMTTNDVLHTLQHYDMIRTSKTNQFVIVLTDAIVEQHLKQKERQKAKGRRFIDPEKLQWKPPVFTASSRTWNW